MAVYETEIRAVRERIAEVEGGLERRISVIQQEAVQQIVRAIRAADEELFRARLFLSSVSGNQPLGGADTKQLSEQFSDAGNLVPVRGNAETYSPKKRVVRKASQEKDRPRKSVRVLLLEMLAGADNGIAEAEFDAAVANLGLTKDASRKAKGVAKSDGTVEVKDGLLFITPAGKDRLSGVSTA